MMNRPTLCVDLDDVIADAKPWRDRLGGTFADEASDHPELPGLEREFYKQGGFSNLEPVPGVQVVLGRAIKAGNSVHIITARPAWHYPQLSYETIDWLSRNGVPYHQLSFSDDKLAVVKACTPRPIAFVEDRSSTAVELAKNGIDVWLMDQEHNRATVGRRITRVKTWVEIEAHLAPWL